MKPVHYILVGVVMLAALAGGYGLLAMRPHQYHGSLIEPAQVAPEISLAKADGTAFRLSEQQGKVVLIFFGYTHCPDVCPLTLGEFKQIKESLGSRAADVEFVFITVDPEQDTPQIMADHTARFDPEFIGLSGSQADLEPVWKSYGVYHQKVPASVGYMMDHSAFTYVVDRQGSLRLTYSFGTPVEDLLSDVEALLKEKP